MAYQITRIRLYVSISVTRTGTASLWQRSVPFYWLYKDCVTHTESWLKTGRSIRITNGFAMAFGSGFGSTRYLHTTLYIPNFRIVLHSWYHSIRRTPFTKMKESGGKKGGTLIVIGFITAPMPRRPTPVTRDLPESLK